MADGNVTVILDAIERGEAWATEQLLPLVYDELRSMARQKMAHEAAEHTLQPTALVHEAYLRLVADGDQRRWQSRGHFYAAAAEAMRRILIEAARRKAAAKRGGHLARVELLDATAESAAPSNEMLLTLDDALQKLEREDSEAASLVKLRYFSGLTVEQAAAALGVSPRTAKRNWSYARAWLQREIEQADACEDG
jgi:RNA polymerase sigma factor (TIGR02999 family)